MNGVSKLPFKTRMPPRLSLQVAPEPADGICGHVPCGSKGFGIWQDVTGERGSLQVPLVTLAPHTGSPAKAQDVVVSMLQWPGASAQKPPSHAAPVMLHVRPLFVQPVSSRQALPDVLQAPATVG